MLAWSLDRFGPDSRQGKISTLLRKSPNAVCITPVEKGSEFHAKFNVQIEENDCWYQERKVFRFKANTSNLFPQASKISADIMRLIRQQLVLRDAEGGKSRDAPVEIQKQWIGTEMCKWALPKTLTGWLKGFIRMLIDMVAHYLVDKVGGNKTAWHEIHKSTSKRKKIGAPPRRDDADPCCKLCVLQKGDGG